MIWPRPWQTGQVRSMVKKPCAARTLPWPLQCWQVDMPVPGLAPRAVAGRAGDERRHVDLDGAAEEGFLERDLEIVAQVRAAQPRLLPPPRRAAPPMKSPKMSSKMSDIEEVNSGPKPLAGPRPAAVLEGGMAEAVVGGALLRVLQRVVGFVDLLELVLGVGIARIAVRVELHGELAVGALERRLVGALRHAQHFVEIALGHSLLPRLSDHARNRRRARRTATWRSSSLESESAAGCPQRSDVIAVTASLRPTSCRPSLPRSRHRRRRRRPACRRPRPWLRPRPGWPCTWPRRASSRLRPARWSFP